jgi:restriction system protein
MTAWSNYQEEVAEFFRELGLDAKTNQTIQGVRTRHAIDVLVRIRYAGLEMTWLVECKAWSSAVPKEKVFALRTIVEDTGADRGFVMAENGYQSGALEAARLTNILLTSLADLKETLSFELGTSRLKTLLPRLEVCRRRYWDIDKNDRIEHDLRHDVGEPGYSGARVIQAVENTLTRALLFGFPVAYDQTDSVFAAFGIPQDQVKIGDVGAIGSPGELFDVLHKELAELEQRLADAETSITKRPDLATSRRE